jgi:hypothetical protein
MVLSGIDLKRVGRGLWGAALQNWKHAGYRIEIFAVKLHIFHHLRPVVCVAS